MKKTSLRGYNLPQIRDKDHVLISFVVLESGPRMSNATNANSPAAKKGWTWRFCLSMNLVLAQL